MKYRATALLIHLLALLSRVAHRCRRCVHWSRLGAPGGYGACSRACGVMHGSIPGCTMWRWR